MAEAFTVAVGALAIIDVTAKVISRCKKLIEAAHDAQKDLRLIFVEISSLNNTLESLHYLLTTDSGFSSSLCHLNQPNGALEDCRSTVEELATILDGLSISRGSQTVSTKPQMLKDSLKWSFKESRAHKLLEKIMQHKATISLALVGEVARDVKDTKYMMGEVWQNIDDYKRRDICNWIECVNPTQDHNNALKLREEHTCRWILRHPDWEKWLAGTIRFIWIHGIPGAGKTVLASSVIEETTSFCSKSQVANVCLYFYCSYHHTEDQVSSFLKWIVSQLCRHLKVVPLEIVNNHEKNAEITIPQLKSALGVLLRQVEVVYIILDAIDECNTRSGLNAIDASHTRKDLLGLLADLVKNPEFARIRILATSRNYVDIEHVLGPLSAPISMSNQFLDEDIKTYVKTELQADKISNTVWTSDLRDEIIEALSQGAKGMFRWAACQLHILRRKRCKDDIRKALRELPKTLEETYERILHDIPNDEREYARTALIWICAHDSMCFKMGIPANPLVSAVFSHNCSGAMTDPHAHDLAALREICGCLIHTSTHEDSFGRSSELGIEPRKESFVTVSLAHYTVKEFLYSNRISNGDLACFSVSKEIIEKDFLGTILKFCAATANLETSSEYFFNNYTGYCREIGRLPPIFWNYSL